MLIVLLILVGYLATGTLLGRRAYANSLSAGTDAERQSLMRQMKEIEHRSDCWLGASYNKNWKDYDCDCRSRNQFNPLKRKVLALDDPISPYPMVFGWPVLAYHSFLTGGKPKRTPESIQAEIDATERRLKIGPYSDAGA